MVRIKILNYLRINGNRLIQNEVKQAEKVSKKMNFTWSITSSIAIVIEDTICNQILSSKWHLICWLNLNWVNHEWKSWSCFCNLFQLMMINCWMKKKVLNQSKGEGKNMETWKTKDFFSSQPCEVRQSFGSVVGTRISESAPFPFLFYHYYHHHLIHPLSS